MGDVADMLSRYRQEVGGGTVNDETTAGSDPASLTADVPTHPYTPGAGRPRSHWGVVETVYFYHGGGQTAAPVQSRFNYECADGDETPCVMPPRAAGPDWTEVKPAWPERVGCLVVTNLGGAAGRGQPTEERRAELAGLALELGVGYQDMLQPVPFGVVRPGHSVRLEPLDGAAYFVRCPAGEARYVVAALPA